MQGVNIFSPSILAKYILKLSGIHMKTIFLFLSFCFLSTHVLSAPELKGSPQELRGFLHPVDKVITIRAEAEEKAYSDKAIVSLVITTESKRLSDSISSNSLLREQIKASLISSGLSDESIKNSKFSSSPEYGWFGSKPDSYKVVNRMAVSITEESHLKELAVVADNFKEVELSDTSFEHTLKDDFNEKVKAKALAKIIKQKEFYESSLGLKLTPIGIKDSNIRHRATRGAMVLEQAMVTSAPREKSSLASDSAYRKKVQKPSFDEVIYQANLSVDFKIE